MSGTEQQEEQAATVAGGFADKYAMKGMPAAQRGGAPSWVDLPPALVLPKNKAITFMKFPSTWTDNPFAGHHLKATEEEVLKGLPTDSDGYLIADGQRMLWRQCIIWPINLAEKYMALGRAKQDPNRAMSEMTMQMIRAYDGKQADFGSEDDGSVGKFYSDIGEKCRTLLDRIYAKLHAIGNTDTNYFLENCVSIRSVGSD